MAKTLLAVDDSATMRKVLEITFSGDDFKVVTADGAKAALAKLSEEPEAVVIDTALGGDDGYVLCQEIRQRAPRAAIVLMASRYNPYDAAKGKDVGADDFMDKPFDTQQMIDKIRRAILAREGSLSGTGQHPYRAPSAQMPAVAAAPPAATTPAAVYAAPTPAPPRPPGPAPAAAVGRTQGSVPRASTLMFGNDMNQPPPHGDDARRATPVPPTPMAPSGAVAAASPTNGHAAALAPMASKLAEIGLTAAQAEAVLALSREVVERVVWEVVPQLAEALIKEEIARLTKEG